MNIRHRWISLYAKPKNQVDYSKYAIKKRIV